MTREEAIRIRASQLAGKAVAQGAAEQAIEVIQATVHARKKRSASPLITEKTPDNPHGFTPSMVAVLDRVCEGKNTYEIAQELKVKPGTVGQQIHQAKARAEVDSLILLALVHDRVRRTQGAA